MPQISDDRGGRLVQAMAANYLTQTWQVSKTCQVLPMHRTGGESKTKSGRILAASADHLHQACNSEQLRLQESDRISSNLSIRIENAAIFTTLDIHVWKCLDWTVSQEK